MFDAEKGLIRRTFPKKTYQDIRTKKESSEPYLSRRRVRIILF